MTYSSVSVVGSAQASNRVDERRLALAAFVFISILAAVLRFWAIGSESFWHDEITMLNITLADAGAIINETEQTGRPPLFLVLGSIWVNIFGTSEAAARALPALAGTLAVMAFFVLGRDLFNWRVAFAAALLMALAEFQIFQAQNYRYYAVYTMAAVLSFLFFYRALKTGALHYFALYAVFTILTYYGHTHGLFVIAAQGLYFLLQILRYRARIVPWLISQALIFIGILPGLMIVLRDLVGGLEAAADAGPETAGPVLGPEWIERPGLVAMIRPLIRFVFYRPDYLTPLPVFVALGFFIALLIISVRRRGFSAWRQSVAALPADVADDVRRHRHALIFVLCWFGFVLGLPLIVSLTFTPLYVDRYLIASSPAYYLLIVLTIYGLRRVIPRGALLGALLIVMGAGLWSYYAEDQNEQWRHLAVVVFAQEAPRDVMVMASTALPRAYQVQETFDWYFTGDQRRCILLELELENAAAVEEFEACATSAPADRFWVVALRWDGDLGIPGIQSGIPDYFLGREDGPWHLALEEHFVKLVLYRFDHDTVRGE